MREGKKEFLELVTNIYILTVLAVVPLYTGGTYWQLGDRKYLLFRNSSIVCLGIGLCVEAVTFLADLLQRCLRKQGISDGEVGNSREIYSWSAMDGCMLAYGILVLASALGSSFWQTVWTGYREWYMGAFSQLIFVGAYFMISRYYRASAWVIRLCEAAFAMVLIIGVLNRLGVDPMGLYTFFEETDWEYSHMLSTIGNINWFCGYCSVMLAFPMAGYLQTERRGKRVLLYCCSVLGLTLLCAQGSTMGPIIAVMGMGICLLAGRNRPQCFRRGLLLPMGVCVLFPLLGGLISLLGTQSATPVDGDIYAKMLWRVWWLFALAAAGLYGLYGRLHGQTQRNVTRILLMLGSASAVAALGFFLWSLKGAPSASWGSGRGGLWSAAFQGFLAGNWKQKLLGAGPDCFAEYIYTIPEAAARIQMEGYWAEAVFTNAHNEWLNQLVNTGILGVTAYLSIFVCGIKRYNGMLLGVLVLGMYMTASVAGFQQVLNAPLLFVTLGICENRCRTAQKNQGEKPQKN